MKHTNSIQNFIPLKLWNCLICLRIRCEKNSHITTDIWIISLLNIIRIKLSMKLVIHIFFRKEEIGGSMFSENNQISGRQVFRLLTYDFLGMGTLLLPTMLADTEMCIRDRDIRQRNVRTAGREKMVFAISAISKRL